MPKIEVPMTLALRPLSRPASPSFTEPRSMSRVPSATAPMAPKIEPKMLKTMWPIRNSLVVT